LPRTEPAARIAVDLVAPAKINLALHVTGRRPDGYHLLETLVVFTRDGDRISVEPADEDQFVLKGPQVTHLEADASNLVLRARDLLRRQTGRDDRFSITLDKRLPVASGLGGGSSDAAATLKALACLWNLKVEDMARDALSLGADLPMCLAARPLIARGIGEEIEPVHALPALDLVLVNPGVPVSTPQIFGLLATRENLPLSPLPSTPSLDSLINWLAANRNDLEAPARALCPPIGDAVAALEAQHCLFARMTGSGATCYGIFADEAAARRSAEHIQARHPHWVVMPTRSLASPEGPFDGRT
jgi:4-diphosphocytidyl-2-C-methyl-D-erythritol kinase